MGIMLFVLFTAMEIALTVLTCKRFRKKSLWVRNKAVCRAAELIVLLLAYVLPGGQKWRFTICLVLFIIRFVLAGVLFLICMKKKPQGEYPKRRAIVMCVISALLIFIALFPAYIFTGYNGLKTSGDHKVKETAAILIDSSRQEMRETDGSSREVPIHFYYPEDGEDCPLVLFSHGSFGYYQSNTSLYMELASNGYVVASIDHPYYAFFTEDTDGKTIIVDMEFMQTAIDLSNDNVDPVEERECAEEWLTIRSADCNFVLDTVKSAKAAGSLSDAWFTKSGKVSDEIVKVLAMTDTSRIGTAGHSIGGAVSLVLGRERDDVLAVVDIDGTMLGEQTGYNNGYEYNTEPYPVPLLSMDNESHWNVNYKIIHDDGTPYVNRYVLDNAIDGYELHYDGTAHMDFTDLPLLSPVLAKMLGKGTIDSEEFVPELNAEVLSFYDHYLMGKGDVSAPAWDPASVDAPAYEYNK